MATTFLSNPSHLCHLILSSNTQNEETENAP